MPKPTRPVADFALRRLLFEHGDTVAAGHPWLREHDRWLELVFAVFASTSEIDEISLRRVVRSLDALGLLDIAEIPEPGQSDDVSGWIKRCTGLVSDEPDRPTSSLDRSLRAVSEISSVLRARHGGRIQRLLRTYAERLRDEVSAELKTTTLNSAEQRQSLTYWLQNIPSLPLPLLDASTEAFVQAHGITTAQLLDAADHLDINVALIDDLIYHDFLAQSKVNRVGEPGTRKAEPHA